MAKISFAGTTFKSLLGKKWTWLILVVCLGFFLRFYDLGGESFVADEFLDVNSAYGYTKTGIWQAWNFNLGSVEKEDVFAPRDERAWLYKWQVAQVLKFLPLNETNARIPSVIWGLISIGAAYWSALKLSRNRKIALLSAFLFAVSVTGIIYDRKVRMYAMFYPVYLILATLIFSFLESKRSESKTFFKSLVGSLNFIALPAILVLALAGFMIHDLTFMVGPTLAAYLAIMIPVSWRSGKRVEMMRYLSFLGAGVVAGFGLYLWRPGYFAILGWGQENSEYVAKLFNDYSYAGLAFLFVIFGSVSLVSQKMVKQAVWLNAGWLTPLFIDVFVGKRTQGLQYIFFAQAFVLILVAVGIYALADYFRQNLKARGERIFSLSVVISLALLPNYAYFWTRDSTYWRDYNEVANYKRVLGTVKKNMQPNDVLVTRNFRNYYLSGAKVKIFDFGGERAARDLDVQDLQNIQANNQSGWVVLFDNDADYLTAEARKYLEQGLDRFKSSQIIGNPKVYRWGVNK